jgi:23S rRNA (cytidine1920-2'-O)/16S rRNA (cytidine1409-2'-O)-methyltransferase
VERGLVESLSQAQRLVMAGQVRVNDQVIPTPNILVLADARLDVKPAHLYVSRGGEKLQAALNAFTIDVNGKICADVGASTGGFTDCLLQAGAHQVYAIDVGKGIFHWKLRQDARVVVMENTNARFVERLPEIIEIVTIDVSFISLKVILPVVKKWFAGTPENLDGGYSSMSIRQVEVSESVGTVIALIKPQFEADRYIVAQSEGVITNPDVHQQVLMDTLGFAQEQGFTIHGLVRSPLLGPKGNSEFLACLFYPGRTYPGSIDRLVAEVLPKMEPGTEINSVTG